MKRFKAQMNSTAPALEFWTFSNILHYGIQTRKNSTSSKLILVFAYSSRKSLCNKHNKRLFFGSDKEISFLGSYIKKSSQRLRDAVKTSFAFEFFQTVKMGKLITLPYRQQKKCSVQHRFRLVTIQVVTLFILAFFRLIQPSIETFEENCVNKRRKKISLTRPNHTHL